MRALDRHIYENIDGATTVLYENDVAVRRILPPDKIAYAGIPVDTDALQRSNFPTGPRKCVSSSDATATACSKRARM